MFQLLLRSSHQTDLYVERAYSSQPHRNAPFCGHIFSLSLFALPIIIRFPFNVLLARPSSFPSCSWFILVPLSHAHSFFIGHCLYSSLFSLLEITFIRNTAIKLNGMFNVRQMFHLLVAVCSFSPSHRFSSCAITLKMLAFCVYTFKTGCSHLWTGNEWKWKKD